MVNFSSNASQVASSVRLISVNPPPELLKWPALKLCRWPMLNEIIQSPNINIFKNRLDKHWSNQEIVFNYRATISGN